MFRPQNIAADAFVAIFDLIVVAVHLISFYWFEIYTRENISLMLLLSIGRAATEEAQAARLRGLLLLLFDWFELILVTTRLLVATCIVVAHTAVRTAVGGVPV